MASPNFFYVLEEKKKEARRSKYFETNFLPFLSLWQSNRTFMCNRYKCTNKMYTFGGVGSVWPRVWLVDILGKNKYG